MQSAQPGSWRSRPRRPPRSAARAGLCALLCVPATQAQTALPLAGELTLPPFPQSASAVPAGTGSLSGEVIDNNGAMIGGALVTVHVNNAVTTATTDQDGRFTLNDVPAGAFSLQITLPGFVPAAESGTLHPGQSLEIPEVVLTIDVVSITVEAVTPEQLALEQLHTEEHQRLVGILPNFFVSYDFNAPPLTWRQKYTLATHNVLDPGNLALAATVAGVQQAANAFPGYHQGTLGYSKRFGADLANLAVGTYMGGAVLPSLFHQDPRYFYKGTGTKRSRFLYAVSRAVITRGDNGHNQPNFAGVLGDLSAAALSNLYYPSTDRQGATLFFENGILSIAGDAMNNFVQEFVFNHITTRGKKTKSQP